MNKGEFRRIIDSSIQMFSDPTHRHIYASGYDTFDTLAKETQLAAKSFIEINDLGCLTDNSQDGVIVKDAKDMYLQRAYVDGFVPSEFIPILLKNFHTRSIVGDSCTESRIVMFWSRLDRPDANEYCGLTKEIQGKKFRILTAFHGGWDELTGMSKELGQQLCRISIIDLQWGRSQSHLHSHLIRALQSCPASSLVRAKEAYPSYKFDLAFLSFLILLWLVLGWLIL